jgi:hypothetical protein
MVRPRETDARFIVRDTSGQALASARVALNLERIRFDLSQYIVFILG